MESSDKNRFIKQHVELYGKELFLNSSLPLIDKGSSKLSKKIGTSFGNKRKAIAL